MTFIVKCAPVLKEWNLCCCSCSLRAAAIVLAWIGTILQVSQFVTCVSYLSHSGMPQSLYVSEGTVVLISILSTVVGALILDVLLLYGIHKKKPVYMLPFLVCDLISIILMMALVLIIGIFATVSDVQIGLIVLVVGSVIVMFTAFFWVVLYSYYRQMEEEKNPNHGIVNCMYQTQNDQVQILPVFEKAPSYFPDKLASDVA